MNDRTVRPTQYFLPQRTRAVLTVLSLSWIAGLAPAAEPGDTQYRFYTSKTEQGLPQNTVKAILQTRDGYLWFSTRFGIVRYDGVAFRVYDRVNTKGLSNDNCLAIAEEENGALWFATPQGVCDYRDGTFVTHKLSEGDLADRVYGMCVCSQGGVWIATADGLKRFQNGVATRFSNSDGLRTNLVVSVLEDADRMLWVGTSEGLQRRDPVDGRFFDAWSPAGVPDKRVQSVFKDRAGNLWIGTEAAGVHRWKDGRWTSFDTREGLTDKRVDFITEDREGNLWAVSGRGELLRFRGGRFAPFGRSEGLSAEVVMCAHEDREGNLWIGTVFGGLKRMQPRRILAYSTSDGLAHNNVWSMCESSRGGLWVGTDAGVSLLKEGKFANHPLQKSLRETVVKSVFEDRSGNLWIGTIKSGLGRFRAGKLTTFTEKEGLTHPQINAIYQDKAGAIWVGTLRGLNRLQDGVITTYTTKDGLSANDIRAIHEDRAGVLWIGTYGGGINQLQNGRFNPITKREGLSDNFAWCIHEDSEGTVWIGTEDGLNRLKNGRVSSFTMQQGLFDNVVNDVLEDGQGNLWISCNRGIYRVSKVQLDAVAEGRRKTVEYVSYGISDGMLASETNGEIQPAACKTRDGRLWFPTTAGVVVIDPDKITLNDLPPPVVIEEILMDNLPLNGKQMTRLGPGHGDVLEVHYTANSLVAPERVQFKYCLEGCDVKWVEAGTRRVAYYTNLSPGHYTFRVIACNNHGIWNTTGAHFRFYLAPRFYQTWPFLVICGLAVILSGYGLHWLRLRVVRKIERLEKLHALEKERARIASEMHDDLGASLTQIALLSELANRELPKADRASQHIRKILDTTREVFRAMDEIVWAINPKHDTLSSLVGYLSNYSQDFLRPADIRCRLDVPTHLPPFPLTTEQRHNLFLTVKEALNNVAKHAAADEVWFRVELHSTHCTIAIEDNGRGFPVGTTPSGRNGLSNMKDRLAAIGGDIKVSSRTGGGTKLELTVRLKQVPRT